MSSAGVDSDGEDTSASGVFSEPSGVSGFSGVSVSWLLLESSVDLEDTDALEVFGVLLSDYPDAYTT